MTFCRGAASCLRRVDFVAKQFGASEGRHREQTCSVGFSSSVCVSLQWSAARADEAYAVAGGVAEFEGDWRVSGSGNRMGLRRRMARRRKKGKTTRRKGKTRKKRGKGSRRRGRFG